MTGCLDRRQADIVGSVFPMQGGAGSNESYRLIKSRHHHLNATIFHALGTVLIAVSPMPKF